MESSNDGTFLYFAFGSNLLRDRIKINSPSAELVGAARLHQHKLGFTGWSHMWHGAVANIFPTTGAPQVDENVPHNPLLSDSLSAENCCVWGAVWRISNEHLPCLDRQEGVDVKEYEPITIAVGLFDGVRGVRVDSAKETESGDQAALQRLVDNLQQLDSPKHDLQNFRTVYVRSYKKVKESNIPNNIKLGLPSDSYKLVILKGAIESGLPLHYVKALASLKTNSNACSAWKNALPETMN